MKRTLLLLLALTACNSDNDDDAGEDTTVDPGTTADASTPGGDGDSTPPGDGDADGDAGNVPQADAGPSQADASTGGPDASTGDDAGEPSDDAGALADGGEPDGLDGGPNGGGEDAGSESDAGGGADAGVDAGPPAPEFVRVFVALGNQGRRAASCDGLVWQRDELAPEGSDVNATLHRGLAYGNHVFVAAVGGGGVQELHYTEDGFAWTATKLVGNGFSDVTFGKGRFVAGGGHAARISTDGKTWSAEQPMGEGGILRHLAYLDHQGGRFAAVGDDGRRMNSVDGVTWDSQVQEGETLTGIAGGNGVFVAIGASGNTRFSTDGGDTWQAGNIGGDNARGILWDGVRFIVTSNTGSYFSTNGQDWEFRGGGTGPFEMAVNDDRSHYVGVEGNHIYHSSDGIGWERKHSLGGPDFTRVAFGWVKPSAECPAP